MAAWVNHSSGICMNFGTQNKAEGYGVSAQLGVTQFGKIIMHVERYTIKLQPVCYVTYGI